MADRLLQTRILVHDATGEVIMDGVSGYSQTVISVSICEIAGADEVFNMWVGTAGGSSPIYVYKGQSIPANATFIHSDKIVIDDTDELWCSMTGTGSLDVICSYLQQDD